VIDINPYLAKQYSLPPCWNLVADFYNAELAQPVDAFRTVNSSIRSIASAFRIAVYKNPNGFKQILEPVENCVVLLGKSERLGLHHCGVFVGGRLLHALESGVQYQEMSVVGDEYVLIEYWAQQ